MGMVKINTLFSPHVEFLPFGVRPVISKKSSRSPLILLIPIFLQANTAFYKTYHIPRWQGKWGAVGTTLKELKLPPHSITIYFPSLQEKLGFWGIIVDYSKLNNIFVLIQMWYLFARVDFCIFREMMTTGLADAFFSSLSKKRVRDSLHTHRRIKTCICSFSHRVW